MEISGYKLIRPLGKGGMSTVYLALQESVNRNVALKVMSEHLTSDESYTARFLREARIAARLTHPNIISILDVNMANGLPYIAMEYAPGGELDSARINSLQLRGQLRVLVQVANALGFLHQQNFLHRDIKPSNILFREDNTAVLTDFGVAIDQAADSRVTLAGYIIGTPHYMSPEQARGGILDARSDIYSLGVLVYRVLAGRVPFTAENAIGICQKHVNEPVPDLPSEHAIFDHVVKKAMAKSPEDRYESATEFIDELISATGRDTARMLRRSLKGDNFGEIGSDDEESTELLQETKALETGTRIQPTFGATPRNRRHPIPVSGDHTRPLAVTPPQQRTSERSRLVTTFHEQPWLLAGGLAGILVVLVGLALVLGTWRSGKAVINPTQEVEVELAEAERLVATGSEANIQRARRMLREILSREPRNVKAAEGLRKSAGLVAPAGEPVSSPDSRAAPADLAIKADTKPTGKPTGSGAPSPEDEMIRKLLVRGHAVMEQLTVSTVGNTSPSSDFREVLMRDPGNREALLALDELADRLLLMAETSLASANLETTGRLLEEIRLTGSGDVKRLAYLELKHEELSDRSEQRSNEISKLLASAEIYLESDNLTKPAGANALQAFQQVLKLDAGNAAAADGFKRLAQRFIQLSQSAIDKGNWPKAEEYWQSANEVAPGLSGADALRQQLDQHRRDTVVQQPAPAEASRSVAGLPPSEITVYRFEGLNLKGNESATTLYDLAESQLNAGNDLRAYGLYRKVLEKDSGNTVARKRLSRGAGVYLKYADRDINQGDLGSAYRNLQIAFALDADDPKADTTRRAYLTARENRISSANVGDNAFSELESMQIKLALEYAETQRARFGSDHKNRTAGTKAIENYQRVLSIQSNHTTAQAGLNALLDMLVIASQNALDRNIIDDAFWFYKAALAIDPNDPRLTQLEERLK